MVLFSVAEEWLKAGAGTGECNVQCETWILLQKMCGMWSLWCLQGKPQYFFAEIDEL